MNTLPCKVYFQRYESNLPKKIYYKTQLDERIYVNGVPNS